MKTPRFAEMADLCRHANPMTPDEIRDFEAAKARVQAEDDRRRQPAPQLELPEAA